MKKKEKTNLGAIFLMVFILIQPLLDTYFMYNYPGLEFLGFRFSTIIRYGILFLLGIILIKDTKLKNYRKIIFCYLIFVLIYFILHHLNALQFNSMHPSNFSYSIVEEIIYIVRYLSVIFIIYYIVCMNIKKTTLKKTIVILSLIISCSIIISNVTYLSRSSYYDYKIAYNFFDWFTKEISYANASTRGFFYSSIVITNLLLITPYIYNIYYKEGKLLYLTTIIFNMLALFMAGTKACTFGFIIVAVVMLFVYLFFTLIKKEIKINYGILIVSIVIISISFGILPKTPSMQRMALTNQLNSANKEIPKPSQTIIDGDSNQIDISKYSNFDDLYNIEDKEEREKALKIYIKNNMNNLGVSTTLLNAYSYEYDYEFWADILKNENSANKSNNRYMQFKILNHIKDVNNNKYDELFGITYSRTSKIFNLERDFIYQYYSLGIIGTVLLLGPVVLLLLICMLKILIVKQLLNMENVSLCLGVGLLLCVALYSGNMLDNLGITMILGLMLGYLCKNIFLYKDGIAENGEKNEI